MYKKILRTIFFIFLILQFSRANAQWGSTTIDSCFEVYDIYDTLTSWTVVVFTDSGNYKIQYQVDWSDLNDTTAWHSPFIAHYYFDVFDSLNRVSERYYQVDSINQWEFYKRIIFSYDSNGQMNDSLIQVYSSGTWNNYSDYSWQTDTAGNYYYNQSRNYIGGQWINVLRQEWIYDGQLNDTLQIFYNGNQSQWDSSKIVRKIFDANGKVTDETTIVLNGSIWVNDTRFTYTYGAFESKYRTGMNWNGISWQCNEFDSITFTSQFNYNHVSGFLDSACAFDGNLADESVTLDAYGNAIGYSYNGQSGSSYGYGGHLYDISRFIYYSDGFSSTMGGLTHDYRCWYYQPLILRADPNHFDLCIGDSIYINTHQNGGAYVYNYTWRYKNQLLPITTHDLSIVPDSTGWYYVTVTDTAGNYFTDSAYVNIHMRNSVLGPDTLLCINDSITLNPGNYSSYLWQDATTLPTITVNSSIPDTLICWVMLTDTMGCNGTDSISIYYSVCQEINDLSKHELDLHPNPARDYLIIKNSEQVLSLSVFNSIGEYRFINYSFLNPETLQLSLSTLSSGFYFLELTTTRERIVRRFIKE